MPAVLNAANEISVEQFLKQKISFQEIPKFIEKTCEVHLKDHNNSPVLDDILSVDSWARNFVMEEISKGAKYIKV